MNAWKIYDKDNRIIFYKHNNLYYIYKYEKGKTITFIISPHKEKTKYQSVFDYIEKGDNYKLNFSFTMHYIEYEINTTKNDGSKETEKGRVPIDLRKKEWSKKILTTKDGSTIGVENFNTERSLIFKIKEEFINNLINK
jgi:hypothetical protein